MNIQTEKVDDGVVVRVHGRIDSVTAPSLEAQLLPLIAENKKLILDLSAVEFVSSAGLRVFLVLAKAGNRNQCKFIVCGASESIGDVIEMSGFGAILTIVPTVATALGQK
jgi:stage II sporulation protein AA (anti-sigma F factor antagonist)